MIRNALQIEYIDNLTDQTRTLLVKTNLRALECMPDSGKDQLLDFIASCPARAVFGDGMQNNADALGLQGNQIGSAELKITRGKNQLTFIAEGICLDQSELSEVGIFLQDRFFMVRAFSLMWVPKNFNITLKWRVSITDGCC